jgi:AhpD family alkylhydroperoxidase
MSAGADEFPPEPRLDYAAAAPEGVRALEGLQHYVDHCGLDHTLLELVKLRCSQINGCAYCVDLHARRLRRAGASQQRIDAVAVWRESPLFTHLERAALGWAEAVTLIGEDHVPFEIYRWVDKYFTGKALADLTFAVIAINAWNRLAVTFRKPTPVEAGKAE